METPGTTLLPWVTPSDLCHQRQRKTLRKEVWPNIPKGPPSKCKAHGAGLPCLDGIRKRRGRTQPSEVDRGGW